MKKKNALKIHNYSFRYAGKEEFALQNICLDVQEGECIVLAGESGCGKSTLLRCLNGIIPHLLKGEVQGEIAVFGNELGTNMSLEELSAVTGSVFQNPRSQFFHIDVTDEIAFGPESMGLSHEEIVCRVDEAFDLFSINHLRGKKMYELSSGEQQKVSFAAIYAAGAEIYLLDEPSANLDYAGVINLNQIVKILKKQKKTIILAEHRLHYLADVLDSIVVLKNGGIEKVFCQGALPENAAMQQWGLRALNLQSFVNESAMCSIPARKASVAEEQKGVPNLSAKKLSFSYPRSGKRVLHNLSVDLGYSEKIAIIGQNGSGKTTFSKLLSGLFEPSEGAIYDEGRGKMRARQRLNATGLVLQESSHQLFFPTVMEELVSARREESEVEPEELLRDLGLEELHNVHPQYLSAGQQQRLVFALATVNHPRILILDEPTSGLDARSMQAVGNQILHASAAGSTVAIVTHDFEFVSSYCDAALLLKDGRVVERIERADFGERLLSCIPIQ